MAICKLCALDSMFALCEHGACPVCRITGDCTGCERVAASDRDHLRAMRDAREGLIPHSLVSSRKTFHQLTSVNGISAWGYDRVPMLTIHTDSDRDYYASIMDAPELHGLYHDWLTTEAPRSSREHGAWERLICAADEYLESIGVEDDFTSNVQNY